MRKSSKIIASVLVLAFLLSITIGFQPVNAQARRETKIYGEDSNSLNLYRNNSDNTRYRESIDLLKGSSNIAIIDEDIYLLYEPSVLNFTINSLFKDASMETKNSTVSILEDVDSTIKMYGEISYKLAKDVVQPANMVYDLVICLGAIGGSIAAPPAAPVLLGGAIKHVVISKVVIEGVKLVSYKLYKDPPDYDYTEIYKPASIDPVMPIDDSEFMRARANQLTKMMEQEQLMEAILISYERMQGADLSREPKYMLLQIEAMSYYTKLLKNNLTQQKELINIQISEMPGYFSSHPEFNYEDVMGDLKEISARGFSEKERAVLLNTGLTIKEIQELEEIFSEAQNWNELINGSLDDLLASMEKQLQWNDELMDMLAETTALLDELTGLAESEIGYLPQLEYTYNTSGGGGVYIGQNASATIKGNTISNNTAEFGGGILAINKSKVTIEDTFINNNTSKYGGGILVGFDSAAVIESNTINGNIADCGAGLLTFMNSSAMVTGNIIDDNLATYNGGSIWVHYDSVLELANPDDNTYIGNIPDDIFYYEDIGDLEAYVYFEETLIKVSANPERGFSWDYYLYIPTSVSGKSKVHLLVGPNNTGYQHDDLNVHDESARVEATRGFKNLFAKKLGVPLLVPVFPRPANEWWIYTQSLDRNTLLMNKGRLARIDLQLIAMIEDAKLILTNQGLNMEEKIFMKGFSACSTFSNRFAILHPHMVRAVASGGINSIPTFPTGEWVGERLRYPVGIADIKEIAGVEFDFEKYIKVAQYIYMGSEDDNDTTPFSDAYDRVDAYLIWRVVGKEMDDRWRKSEQIYKELGIPAQFVTYQGVGHTITPQMINDVVAFFEANTND